MGVGVGSTQDLGPCHYILKVGQWEWGWCRGELSQG